MSGSGRDEFERHAIETPFDKDNDPSCEFVSENVQDVIEELCNRLAVSANPGFTWGRSGNVTTNTWLLNDTVPSNKAGRTVTLANGEVTRILTASENLDTYDITIFEHDGDEINLASVVTKSVVASRTGDFVVTSASITQGKQLAAKITSGSAKNLVIGIFLQGETS